MSCDLLSGFSFLRSWRRNFSSLMSQRSTLKSEREQMWRLGQTINTVAVCSTLAFLQLFPAFTECLPLFLLILSPYVEASGVNTECLVLIPILFSVVWVSLSSPQLLTQKIRLHCWLMWVTVDQGDSRHMWHKSWAVQGNQMTTQKPQACVESIKLLGSVKLYARPVLNTPQHSNEGIFVWIFDVDRS